MSLLTYRRRIGFVAALAAAAAAIFLIYQSQDGLNESKPKPTPVALSAYLKEGTVELSKKKDTTYEVKLLMDDFPDGAEVVQIRALLNIPAAFEVDAIVPNPSNIPVAAVAFQPVKGGMELRIGNDDGSVISFANLDGSKELATITLKQKRELIVRMKEELKVSSLEIVESDHKSKAYDVSGASSAMSYEPPASAIGKLPQNGNPIVSHKFGADPYAIVYNDRVYIYSTYDVLEYDEAGEVKDNTYGSINRLSIVSSSDLMNWTDHGFIVVAGREGEAKWATQSWAPAAAHKVIDGKDKFFLYFANNASGIGVLTSDSPTGPWIDPIGKPLISRSAPAAEGVTWLFDPAVLVDDDGKAYIYFGGGVPEGKDEKPDTARVMQLGEDMISVIGEAAVIPAPFMFEDAGINKVGGTYYYTYCSNFYGGARPEGSPPAGEIAYMTSDHPMGPWAYQGTILKNPGHFFGVGGNNHHAMFQFHSEWYIAYHAQTLSKAMGVPKGYRSTHLNKVSFSEDGAIQEIEADLKGVPQLNKLNPFVRVEAETLAWSAGIDALPLQMDDRGTAVVEVAIAGIHNGDWTAVSSVDFGEGASTFSASVAGGSDDAVIELRLDSPDGDLIGSLAVPKAYGSGSWTEVKTAVAGAEGVHDLYFVFKGKDDTELFTFNAWQFGK
ncbi:glycoside hydrolase family 43 protein [Paenibacillus sp. PL91]|uniref:glycoside hydrolase family 43 protein n=1 Tax=Paenibacillus sp. PL91 TaxID=2729538 RepID=UPI00294FF2C7|nr:glycoside hydrolase family 43 protein [Paenibacillus sp. PL91]